LVRGYESAGISGFEKYRDLEIWQQVIDQVSIDYQKTDTGT
jgi:hypothetical protein